MKFAKKDKRTMLEKEIDRLLKKMSTMDPLSKDYQDLEKSLDRLVEAESKQRSAKMKPKEPINKNTILALTGNFASIWFIVNYERLHVITSKALGWVSKGRV